MGAARPGEDLEPVVVVVVVRTLTLGQGSPGAGDVTGGVHVLEKVQRERLIGENRPRKRRTVRPARVIRGPVCSPFAGRSGGRRSTHRSALTSDPGRNTSAA